MTINRVLRRSPRPILPLLAWSAAVLGIVGCGDADKPKPAPSPEAQVRATWRSAAAAAAGGEGTAFCARVAPAGKAKLTAATQLPCEDSIRLLASQLTPADREAIRTAKITRVTITGDSAVVRYVTTPALAKLGFSGRTSLTKTGDRWLLLGI